MSLEPEHKIGDKVFYWCADDPKNREKGRVVDFALGESLCTYEEDTGREYDESDDACGYEHDNWYIKVKLNDGTVTDWSDEYYWREVSE